MNDDDDDNPLETDLLFTIEATGAANSALRITPRGWDYIADRLDSPSQAFEVAQILSARVVHESDQDYVLGEDGITLVDRLDGRPMHSHRYVNGLHEALESKEGIEGNAHANPVARTTIHALMSNYATIAGLTGTATESADIFSQDYGATTVRVPSTFPTRRVDLDTQVFFDRSEHARALSDEVAHWHRVGRPLLIAFGSVRESSEFSDALERQGIPHRLLNASNPSQESDIVERAGEHGAVTVSTGMAGRGTDIILTKDNHSRAATREIPDKNPALPDTNPATPSSFPRPSLVIPAKGSPQAIQRRGTDPAINPKSPAASRTKPERTRPVGHNRVPARFPAR